MPQVFQVLRCYKCLSFQVHQVKKSNKWECKLCGEKQSIKRHYGVGTGKECRVHVQKLNELRGEKIEQHISNVDSDDDFESSEEGARHCVKVVTKKESKWSNFTENIESNVPSDAENETLFDKEVVLELPKKRKKIFKKNCRMIKTKYKTEQSEDDDFEDDRACNTIAILCNDNTNQTCRKQIKRFIPPTTNLTSKRTEHNIPSDNTDDAHINAIPQPKLWTCEKNETFTCNKSKENSFRNTYPIENDKISCDKFEKINEFTQLAYNKNDCLEVNNKKEYFNPVVSTLKKDSKWADYLDNIDCGSEQAQNNEDFESIQCGGSTNGKTATMFSLCNDNDLDSVLEI